MRRMIAFLLCGFVLFLLNGGKLPDLTSFDKAQRVVLVLGEKSEIYGEGIESGEEYYYAFEGDEMYEILGTLNDIENLKGLNLYFAADVSISYFQQRLDYLGDESRVEGMSVYYGFFKNFHKFELIDGKKINVQLVRCDDGWIMGLPIILTGF